MIGSSTLDVELRKDLTYCEIPVLSPRRRHLRRPLTEGGMSKPKQSRRGFAAPQEACSGLVWRSCHPKVDDLCLLRGKKQLAPLASVTPTLKPEEPQLLFNHRIPIIPES